jgi:hypothetical protein
MEFILDSLFQHLDDLYRHAGRDLDGGQVSFLRTGRVLASG